MTPLKPQLYFC